MSALNDEFDALTPRIQEELPRIPSGTDLNYSMVLAVLNFQVGANASPDDYLQLVI